MFLTNFLKVHEVLKLTDYTFLKLPNHLFETLHEKTNISHMRKQSNCEVDKSIFVFTT